MSEPIEVDPEKAMGIASNGAQARDCPEKQLTYISTRLPRFQNYLEMLGKRRSEGISVLL